MLKTKVKGNMKRLSKKISFLYFKLLFGADVVVDVVDVVVDVVDVVVEGVEIVVAVVACCVVID